MAVKAEGRVFAWGMIGSIIMTHGDDKGLCTFHTFTSRTALYPQAVIIPIVKKEADRVPVMEAAAKLEAAAKQAGIRVKVRGSGLMERRIRGWQRAR